MLRKAREAAACKAKDEAVKKPALAREDQSRKIREDAARKNTKDAARQTAQDSEGNMRKNGQVSRTPKDEADGRAWQDNCKNFSSSSQAAQRTCEAPIRKDGLLKQGFVRRDTS